MAAFTDKQLLVGGAVFLLGGYLLTRKAEAAAVAVVEAVNPINPGNIFHTGFNHLGGAVTGKKHFSLGAQIYDGVDSIRGLWGDSDADRYAEAGRVALAQQSALGNLTKSIGL